MNFESGLLNGNNFKGKWITHTLGEVEKHAQFSRRNSKLIKKF